MNNITHFSLSDCQGEVYLKRDMATWPNPLPEFRSIDLAGSHDSIFLGSEMIQNKVGWKIRNLADWHDLAPPQQAYHWAELHSAMELACAWLRTGVPAVPQELIDLISSHQHTRGLAIETAIVEAETRLDRYRGMNRHHDLIALGRRQNVSMLVGVEAKADEPFGKTIEQELAGNPHGNLPNRINLLAQAIFGAAAIDNGGVNPAFGPLRYQLLHGLGGTLIEARNRQADRAIFVVHEFRSAQLNQQAFDANQADLEAFLQHIPGFGNQPVQPGSLIGPLNVPGGEFVPNDRPLYVGKVSVTLN